MTSVVPARWTDVTFDRFEAAYRTSTGTARIRVRGKDQAFSAYIKALGNPAGPHALACEWVASCLARWFELPTLDFGIIMVDQDDEIPVNDGPAAPGPAFVSRHRAGRTWSGAPEELEALTNPEDVPRLVIFDTWVLNCDRHSVSDGRSRINYDNVFLSEEGKEPGTAELVAMDHTHCFTCGRELAKKIASIGHVRDTKVYGLFPQFKPLMEVSQVTKAAKKLTALDSTQVEAIVQSIPVEWKVAADVQSALATFILDRATYLADAAEGMLRPFCTGRQGTLNFGKEDSHGRT